MSANFNQISLFLIFRTWIIQFKIFTNTRSIKSLLQTDEIPNLSKLAFLATRQLSKTLTHMSESFIAIRNFDLAQLSAFMAYEKALKFRHFREISKSTSNILHVIHRLNCSQKYLWMMKGMFEQICRSIFLSLVNVEGLFAMMRVYEHSMKCL